MDQMEREKRDLAFEIGKRLRKYNLLTLAPEFARSQGPITTVINDLQRYSYVPKGAREVIFRETFAKLVEESHTNSQTGKEPFVAA